MTLNPKRWQPAPRAPASQFRRLGDLDPAIVQVLYNRGIVDAAEVEVFLNGRGEERNPFDLPDMSTAVTRIRQALRAREPIAVYGDFDVDGVTATVVLVQTLRALGGDVRPYIPHRMDEGYGLNKEALTELAEAGTRVVITVDCGVRSIPEIEHANQLGLDVIITDHHSVTRPMPPASAIIDPKRPDSDYPFKQLAGVGIAYKLAQALLRSHQQTPVTDKRVRLREEDLLDLVALGTVADLAPLLDENRALVKRGLVRLNQMERPGVEALCRMKNLTRGQVTAASIGYVLGPRLNAAGRMADAELAYQLLDTQYPAEAERLARDLEHLNRERQELTRETQQRARELALASDPEANILFAADPEFQPGIVGLVASRLVDNFYRPAVVVEVGEDFSRGSARSIPEFHITNALDQCADLFKRHGGHAAAAGFKIATASLPVLEQKLHQLADTELGGMDLTPTLPYDMEIELSRMTWDLLRALEALEPCGYGNPHPLFLSKNVAVRYQRAVGKEGRHLKLTLSDGNTFWDAIAFRQGEWANKLPDHIDVVYKLEVNEWNGQRNLQLNVQDLRPPGIDEFGARQWLLGEPSE